MIKKFLNIFLNYIGYRISKNKIYSFDHIYISFFTENPSIIDVGANQGESVDRFLRIFQNPKIHCFEPALDSFNVLKKKYNSKKNIYLNNLGLSSKKEKKVINIFQRSCNSSFNEPIKDSFWEQKKNNF
jgi:hypothetical protein